MSIWYSHDFHVSSNFVGLSLIPDCSTACSIANLRPAVFDAFSVVTCLHASNPFLSDTLCNSLKLRPVISVVSKTYSVWLNVRVVIADSSVVVGRFVTETLRSAGVSRTFHPPRWGNFRAWNGTRVMSSHRCRTEKDSQQASGVLPCLLSSYHSSATMRKFCLLCDTIDDSGISTQRHNDEDKCAKWFETWGDTWVNVDFLYSWEVKLRDNWKQSVHVNRSVLLTSTSLRLRKSTQTHSGNTLISSKYRFRILLHTVEDLLTSAISSTICETGIFTSAISATICETGILTSAISATICETEILTSTISSTICEIGIFTICSSSSGFPTHTKYSSWSIVCTCFSTTLYSSWIHSMTSLHRFAPIALHSTEDNKRRITWLIKQSDSPCLLQSK